MRFAYVPFGERVGFRAAACDGLVPGAAVDLSHWSRNQTPAHLKRDTSVEIALAFAEERAAHDVEGIANNHFDADGVLACWSVLRPELARAHAGRIIGAAEAGDFDQWPEDETGLWLEAAISSLAGPGGDRAAYERVLPMLDELVPNVASREDLWGRSHAALLEAGRQVERGSVEIQSHGRIALISHSPGATELPGPWIHRLASKTADRWLLAFADASGGWQYRYERPRWAWADTVLRPTISMPRRGPIRRALGPAWVIKGKKGMTGIAYTDRLVLDPPEAVAQRLAEIDCA
jgi:hypothetical protein